ncbi:MAG: glycerol-3-phosphate dehydrogenase [Sphingomonadaceae bacterium]
MTEIYDIAIIGGGVNGAGIARDAAGRGASVVLLEKGDLASGTSSASTKLIHGGLRYLEHYEFSLVREALQEREKLWAIAPHIIEPLRFVLPYDAGMRPKWMLRTGLFLYDHIGGRQSLPRSESISLPDHEAGAWLKTKYSSGFVYSDCRVDDARLVVLNAMDAASRGANIRHHCAVTGMTRQQSYWIVETECGTFHARSVVNAAGPFALDIISMAGMSTHRHMRLVRGSHIVVPRLFDHAFAYIFQQPDGRILFAIPYQQDYTLIGTTDQDQTEKLDTIRTSGEEITYLCEGVNRYFQSRITPDDVIWHYAGVRALVDDGSGRPEAATRGYRLDMHGTDDGGPVMLSVLGGKITTYRHLAESAVTTLSPYCGALASPDWTAGQPLPGGDFPRDGREGLIARFQEDYPFLPASMARRLLCSYGTRCYQIMKQKRDLSDLGHHFGHDLYQSEVDYLCEHEWARSAEDIVWRRSKLGLHMKSCQIRGLEEYMAGRSGEIPNRLRSQT